MLGPGIPMLFPPCTGGGGGAICGAIGGAPAGPQPEKREEVITSLAPQIDLLVVWRIAAFRGEEICRRGADSVSVGRFPGRGRVCPKSRAPRRKQDRHNQRSDDGDQRKDTADP